MKPPLFFLRPLGFLVAVLPQMAFPQIDSSSQGVRLHDVEAGVELGGSVVFLARIEAGLASHRVAIGYRHSREIPTLLFISENHPKRIVNEVSVHYVLSTPGKKTLYFSAGPGFVFGDGRGALLRSEPKGSEVLYFGADRNYYNPREIRSLCLSGDVQILVSLFGLAEFGASLHGNLNRQDSFWSLGAILKIHIIRDASVE